MPLHSALLKNSFLEKEPAEGEQKAVTFLQGHKRIVSFFQKKLGYVLVLILGQLVPSLPHGAAR